MRRLHASTHPSCTLTPVLLSLQLSAYCPCHVLAAALQADAAAKAGLMPGKAPVANPAGARPSSSHAATEAAAASADAAETAVHNSSCRLEGSPEPSSRLAAAAADMQGGAGNIPLGRNSAPAGAATADSGAAAAAAAGFHAAAGDEALMQDALMQLEMQAEQLDLFCAGGNQHKKRPPQRAQTQRVLQQPQPRRSVKRHKSQQLLGSAVSTEVANADRTVFTGHQQQGLVPSDGFGLSEPCAPSAGGFGAACGQLVSAQLRTTCTVSAGSSAAGLGGAGFTDVYTQLALADAAEAAAEAAVQSQHRQLPQQQAQAGASWQGGMQDCTAAVGSGGLVYAASGPEPMLFDLPVQQLDLATGSKGFDDDAWLLEDFDINIPGSPTLADLLLACSPAASPRATGGWDWPQLPSRTGLAQAPQTSTVPTQHNSGAAQIASAAISDAVVGGAGTGVDAGAPAASLHGQQPAAATVLEGAAQGPSHIGLGPCEVSAAGTGLQAAWHYGGADAAMHGHSLGVSGLPAAASAGTATVGSAKWSGLGCPAAGMQHAGLSTAPPGYQGTWPAETAVPAAAGPPAAGLISSHVATAAPAGSAPGLGMGAMQCAGIADGGQSSSWRAQTSDFGLAGGYNSMMMPVLARRSSPAVLSPMGSAGYACSSTCVLSPARCPPPRHASTADLRQTNRGMAASRQQQEVQRVMSVGHMQEQLAMAGVGQYFGLSCMPHGRPSTAGDPQGSVLGMGLPAGQSLRPCVSWNGAVLAGGNSSSSSGALQEGYMPQHMASERAYGPSTGRGAAAADSAPAVAWPVTRMSFLQAMQPAAAPGHGFEAVTTAQPQPERHYSATAGMMDFVAEVLRASNGHMATAANSILPVLAAAAVQGHTIAPALKQLQIALLEAHLQQQQAQLLDMMDNAAVSRSEAARNVETTAIVATLSAITDMEGPGTAAAVHSGIRQNHFAHGGLQPTTYPAGVPPGGAFNTAVSAAGVGTQLNDPAYLAGVPVAAPDGRIAGAAGLAGFFGNQPGM